MDIGLVFAFFVIAAMIYLLFALPFMIKFVEPIEDEDKPLSPIMRTLIEWGFVKQITEKEKKENKWENLSVWKKICFRFMFGGFFIGLLWWISEEIDAGFRDHVIEMIKLFVVIILMNTIFDVLESRSQPNEKEKKFQNRTVLSNFLIDLIITSIIFLPMLWVFDEKLEWGEGVVGIALPIMVFLLVINTVLDVLGRRSQPNEEE